ncbi:LAGLIDADG family homing endonuclease [Robertmurraya sp. P23]
MKEWEASYIAGIIDGEGSITLTRMHKGEFRRPCISISSTDRELLFT